MNDLELYDLPWVAGRLKVSMRTVQRLIDSGRLTAVDVGTADRPRWRVTPEALTAFVEASTVGAAS